MSDLAVRIEGLGKRYRLGNWQPYHTLRESLQRIVLAPFRRAWRPPPPADLWALRNLSLEIRKGEVIGLIGSNGAGKSTLLKILSRITPPTEGTVEITGRARALLEVGTGFHPELTGRENVYLNGAILGMTRSQVRGKFDRIVAFSGIESHIDTPVKRYSSGMYIRLAFSVAAHLDPDILLVDEVLAVGDAAFQKKCLGILGEVAREGRTVVLVSHNMAAIAGLCPRSILIEKGHLREDGETQSVIASYLQTESSVNPVIVYPRDPDRTIQFRRIEVHNQQGIPALEIDRRESFSVHLQFEVRGPCPRFNMSFCFETLEGIRIFDSLLSDSTGGDCMPVQNGEKYGVILEVPGGLLRKGAYRFRVTLDNYLDMKNFDVQSPFTLHLAEYQTSSGFPSTQGRSGILDLPIAWKLERQAAGTGKGIDE